ncbi:MAG TPA: peptide ABC transporter substrate-binding protein, partial [Pseudobdellovibrionaceae bacterium]|nr:peptide ABC transporter substrate-binding protein [Pseudobdellovibrionaceae bacterium]
MNVFNSLVAVAMTLALALPALAATVPNEKAPVGGTINYNLDGEPPTIHPIMSTDLYASKVQAFVGDTLASRDSNTYEWKPRIAEKWEIA